MLKMRLSMGGTKKRPVYKIVVADSRFPRDGRFIEKLGFYNPLLPKDKKERIGLDSERIKYWLGQGAQPTTRVARLLGENDIMPMPEKGNNPQKAIPKKDRKKADEGGEAKPEGDASKPAEAPKEEAKPAEAPKEEAKPAEAPKEEGKKIMLEARIFTLYPDFFPGYLGQGIFGKALSENKWKIDTVDIREYAFDKHKTVDDTPYGGGEGMLMKADVLAKSIDKNVKDGEKIIYLSPKGKLFNHQLAKQLSQEKTINIICGHFEGVDERLLKTRNIEEVSIGDFVLSGGEGASFVILDAILRFIPGILGNTNSAKEESFENGLLEYPQFTKPQIWEEKSVPDVLLSGDHAKIKDWRLSQSEAITRDRRPDLWQLYKKTKEN